MGVLSVVCTLSLSLWCSGQGLVEAVDWLVTDIVSRIYMLD
jgi:hypothetical protein